MKNKSLASYLDQNPEISQYSNLFSGNQAHKELQITVNNTGTITPKHKHAVKLMNGLKKNRVYDDNVVTGKAKNLYALNKKQIFGRLHRVDDTVLGAHKAFKKAHVFKAVKNLSVKPSLNPSQIKSYTNHKMAKLQHNGITTSKSNISNKIARSTKSVKPVRRRHKSINKNQKLRLLKIKRTRGLHR